MTDTVVARPDSGQDGLLRTRTFSWEDPLTGATAATEMTGLDYLRAMQAGNLPAPPLLHMLDMRLESVESGVVVFGMTPSEFHYNPIGSVHGGVYSTLLDSAAGCAVHSLLPAGTGYTSQDLSVRFLGAIRVDTGPVRCTGTVRHLGRRTALAEATLETTAGKLLATATSNCLILRR
ncbi:PaaI family thioesterase [Mycobacterium cookii]|uniref:Aromatic compound degradation protein PaaI n=1 Tax=Mycobacterium cookii TaxID=1775 RepID=A0A7I7L067_9MYCO|nr:PaaI family thioesterase [Mycobacterium cookii]MCV7333226.1 PaaI family thioesterase [Mycobacterium cookii]BBX47760.1 aromatic compound degradation protein PaaI [Mycobacterium cookii]